MTGAVASRTVSRQRREMRVIALSLLVLLAACAARQVPARASGEEVKSLVPTVYIIRHMEKATGDDPVLSAGGQAAALRLAEALRDKGVATVFVTATRRSRLSAEPLAALAGARIETYDPKDNPALVARVAAIPGSVLVVGHSNTVPGLVAAFGGTPPPPMDESDYGRLFAVRRADGATVESRP